MSYLFLSCTENDINEYSYTAAFAVSSMLALLAIFTLILKTWVEYRQEKQDRAQQDSSV